MSAIRELYWGKGAQFDPLLVDVFSKFLNDPPFTMKGFSYCFLG